MTTKLRSAALAAGALVAGVSLLAACDKSPQNADGTTARNDPGSAAATPNNTLADTGQDNAGAQIGASGELGVAESIGGATSPGGVRPEAPARPPPPIPPDEATPAPK
jgi:hypothetical protein